MCSFAVAKHPTGTKNMTREYHFKRHNVITYWILGGMDEYAILMPHSEVPSTLFVCTKWPPPSELSEWDDLYQMIMQRRRSQVTTRSTAYRTHKLPTLTFCSKPTLCRSS